MDKFERIVLIVLDGVGCGAMPDANLYFDQGANTLEHIAAAVGPFALPHLQALGLGNITPLAGVAQRLSPRASWGKMAERSRAKDSTTGHWEIAGVVMSEPFQVYAQGFPSDIMQGFARIAGVEALGNIPASGTDIIQTLGPEHMRSGRPIVYTSTDSVFQIAAHEEIIPLERLYTICRKTRDLLDHFRVGRVIARPFVGDESAGFVRTSRRRDFSIPPPAPTLLDQLQHHGIGVHAVGKISDIFCGRGIDKHVSTTSNAEGMQATEEMFAHLERGLVFTNLIDFDMNYGHRRDCFGFATALQQFDTWLGKFLPSMGNTDLLLLTADHGCDPCMPGSDHTREYVPLLAYTPQVKQGKNLGVRTSFADIAATILQNFGLHVNLKDSLCGDSFLDELASAATVP
ncbi:MAG: phosphopentomutase [Desulfuromonadaceae bacterium]|nr:phosphopentomutase [Desulfuromonas sp.]MDY0185663.1 phosphopentomutase [Desulfuromonadaceae bacterium]